MKNWIKKKILDSRAAQPIAYKEVTKLIVRERAGKKIILNDERNLVEFMSCSYLGLDQHPKILAAVANQLNKTGINFPVSRTRLRMENLCILENYLGQMFNGCVTTFTSLHLTHQGILPLIASGELPSYPVKNNGVFFVLDKTAHSSMQINMKILASLGKVIRVNFEDLDALKKIFKKARASFMTPIALCDGIGSMGSKAAVMSLIAIAEEYDGYLYFDDAHGTSIYGLYGQGYILNEIGYFHPRIILAASLSKGFGTNGGLIVVASKKDDEVIKSFSNPYIFSNPLASPIVEASIASAKIHLSSELSLLQLALQERIKVFDNFICEKCNATEVINMGSNIPVRGILIKDEEKTVQFAIAMQQEGYALSAVTYPSVARGRAMLRITLGADHQLTDISNLCNAMHKVNQSIN